GDEWFDDGVDLTAQVDEVDAIVEPLIAAARTDPAPGLLRVLFDSADQQPLYTDRLIRDELVTLLTAGYETTATTLGWLFLLLHQHPEQRTWALAAGPAGSPARTEAIRALVSETLRLYPTAWLLPRYAAEDGTLGGHRVLAGTTILICPYLTHRDPDIWPEPDRFLPQRFLDPHRRTPPGAYYPFGIGPRACLGAQFAVREITILLERLLPAFTAAFPDIPGQRFGVTIQPDRELTATITTTT
ncbi:cytochrome P450, partial [Streptomyces clavuligerus]|uniref:cytochrome P450 n=1 Tax=Streptomyces clavuligerus TaxID=1901 RepID=UPI0018D087D5